MAKSVQRGRLGRGLLRKPSWPWEDWLDVLWDRKQKLELDLFRFMPERKIQAALRRLLKPGDQLEAKRFPKLAPVKRNPLLTKEYLGPKWGLAKAVDRLEARILSERFEAQPQGILGGVKHCPPEKTAAQLRPRKMGAPTKYHRAMTPAERKRRQRNKEVFDTRKGLGILPDSPSGGEPFDLAAYRRLPPWRQLTF